ncbi:MAG: hypothetical protein GEU71_14725 [Actinobacteria bacterium]|nr:hypothetical protein [Actinomycetota bacterium]
MKFFNGRRPSVATPIALMALVVALGGSAYATHLTVKASDIVNKAVRARHIKPGAVRTGKLADAAVNGTKITDGAVTNTKIDDGQVNAAKLATGAVTFPKIAGGAVGTSRLADGAVTISKLNGVTGVFTRNFPSVPAHDCYDGSESIVEASGVTTSDNIILTADDTWSVDLVPNVRQASSAGFIFLVVCNPTDSAINPPSTNWRFITIHP